MPLPSPLRSFPGLLLFMIGGRRASALPGVPIGRQMEGRVTGCAPTCVSFDGKTLRPRVKAAAEARDGEMSVTALSVVLERKLHRRGEGDLKSGMSAKGGWGRVSAKMTTTTQTITTTTHLLEDLDDIFLK